jgi:hypothetical protein
MKALASAVGVLALISTSGAASASAPQTPFAVGPMLSVSKVKAAATACGVGKMRVESGAGWPDPTVIRLYFDEPISPQVDHCVMHWETAHGRALHLRPRWPGDTFTHDAPPGAKW